MQNIQTKVTQSLFLILILVLATLLSTLRVAALTNSSLLLSDPRTTRTGVSYTFSSTGFSATSVQCIDIIFNTQSDGGGSVPAGMTTTSFTFDTSTAVTVGNWTENTAVNGRLRITSAGETVSNGNFVFGGITNGTTENDDYFAIFTSYTDASCTGGNEVDEVVVAFVFTDGELVQLTIDPTLTFTVASVGTSQAVNGATTTVASTASGINHQNTVTFAANGISAHDLQVGTNATGGYTVYIRHTGLLTNGSDTIANHTGTNVTPTAFPAAGTEAWGYTTEDSSLAGGTANRFTTAGNVWAGFTTSNDIIADNPSAPSGTETTRVGHQVGVAATTPAGTYQTTVIYTVASVY